MNRTISPAALKSLLASGKDVLVLDVRRRSDYDADRCTLPHAAWRDPEQVAQWSATLPQDREIVVYCVHGRSVSNTVLDHLRQSGLAARSLEGGIEAWKQSGGATVNQ